MCVCFGGGDAGKFQTLDLLEGVPSRLSTSLGSIFYIQAFLTTLINSKNWGCHGNCPISLSSKVHNHSWLLVLYGGWTEIVFHMEPHKSSFIDPRKRTKCFFYFATISF